MSWKRELEQKGIKVGEIFWKLAKGNLRENDVKGNNGTIKEMGKRNYKISDGMRER